MLTSLHRPHCVEEALSLVLTHPDLAKTPVLVLANKQDLPGALSAPRLAEEV